MPQACVDQARTDHFIFTHAPTVTRCPWAERWHAKRFAKLAIKIYIVQAAAGFVIGGALPWFHYFGWL